jgi:transcriptional regulator with XRE-family HTH domain
MNIKKNFGKRIKEIRISANLTQEQLAEKIGISPKSLSQIELGNNFVSAETLESICKTLKIKPRLLFDFDYYDNNKDDFIKEINEKIKSNPNALKIIHKIAISLD